MNTTKEENELVLVQRKALPDVFLKVLKAKESLSGDIAKNSTEACRLAELSRSAFYKYKDSVFLYEEKDKTRVITLSLRLSDKPGVLSRVLSLLSTYSVNVLTVNQNIPVDRVAVVTLSFRPQQEEFTTDKLLNEISQIDGVIRSKEI